MGRKHSNEVKVWGDGGITRGERRRGAIIRKSKKGQEKAENNKKKQKKQKRMKNNKKKQKTTEKNRKLQKKAHIDEHHLTEDRKNGEGEVDLKEIVQ